MEKIAKFLLEKWKFSAKMRWKRSLPADEILLPMIAPELGSVDYYLQKTKVNCCKKPKQNTAKNQISSCFSQV